MAKSTYKTCFIFVITLFCSKVFSLQTCDPNDPETCQFGGNCEPYPRYGRNTYMCVCPQRNILEYEINYHCGRFFESNIVRQYLNDAQRYQSECLQQIRIEKVLEVETQSELGKCSRQTGLQSIDEYEQCSYEESHLCHGSLCLKSPTLPPFCFCKHGYVSDRCDKRVSAGVGRVVPKQAKTNINYENAFYYCLALSCVLSIVLLAQTLRGKKSCAKKSNDAEEAMPDKPVVMDGRKEEEIIS